MSAPNETPMTERTAEAVAVRTKQIVGSLAERPADRQVLLLLARHVALLEQLVAEVEGWHMDEAGRA